MHYSLFQTIFEVASTVSENEVAYFIYKLKLILGLDISFYKLFDSVSKLASIIFQCFFFKNIRDN